MAKKKPTVVALIDADYLEYAAGFAGQHTSYVIVIDGEALLGRYANRDEVSTAIRMWQDQGGDPARLKVYDNVEVEPVENVLHSTKKMVQSIVERVGEKFKANVEPKVFLTGSGNFRERIATIRPYKGNRKPWHKPRLQREIRDYLTKNWGATVVYDQEADDEVCIQQSAFNATGGKQMSIICGIDKDLLQCPGWHYDANKDAFAHISEAQGTVQFYKQLLTGDTTDNVGGCYRMGAKAASDMIATAKKAMEGQELEKLAPFLYSQVLQAYEHSIQKYGEQTGYEKLGAEGAVLENARLLWLRRYYGETWAPPK